jgi:hypothetical protein
VSLAICKQTDMRYVENRCVTDRQIAPSPLAQLRDVDAAIRRLVIASDRGRA